MYRAYLDTSTIEAPAQLVRSWLKSRGFIGEPLASPRLAHCSPNEWIWFLPAGGIIIQNQGFFIFIAPNRRRLCAMLRAMKIQGLVSFERKGGQNGTA